MIARRAGIAGMVALLLAPAIASAQAPSPPKVGYLQIYPSANDTRFEQFKQTLHDQVIE